MKLLVATGNKGKLAEFERILGPLGVELVPPEAVGAVMDVEENGETFAQNARIKAEYLFRQTGMPTVADDSGLCVDALDGRPGVHSARYQGEDTPYPEKMAALLRELEGVPEGKRAARFVAAICCVLDETTVLECQGVCRGTVAFAPQGDGGFGYDPLFLTGEGSFASLTAEQKDRLSHRGKALRELKQKLDAYLSEKENTE